MSGQEPVSNRYVVDTNIVIYILQGLEEIVKAMEELEDDDIEVYYSTIVIMDPEIQTVKKAKLRYN
jgi:rRNA-processing protein FCF1